ncbi:MAG TPA: DnaB-like helicase C-terminal domain-containing protein [Candidatus Sulfotelmatobacter sp.]|nr:DnaB-like helicase C-terminal domain-containing protein [Candidatus Sulfotelmatobacter sp.]
MVSDHNALETAVLASVSNDPYMLTKAIEQGFRVELLYSPEARTVASMLMTARSQPGTAVDLLVLKSKLEENGLLTAEVTQFIEVLRTTPRPELDKLLSYIEILKDREARTRLLKLANRIAHYARGEAEGGASVVDFTASAFQELVEIQHERNRKRVAPINEMVQQIIMESRARPKGERTLLGYSVGSFPRLTRVLSGLRRGFYYGLAGAPRRGKTTLALQLAASLTTSHHIPVLYYSWEQTRKVLTARLIAKDSGVNPTTLLSHDLESLTNISKHFAKGLAMVRAYEDSLFVLEGNRQDTVDRIRATAYNLMHEFRTDSIAIFLDYLQKVPLARPSDDLGLRIDQISTELADLSLELNCPVFAIAALDKEGCRLDDEPTGEEKYDELQIRARPTMHHCTGGGDIEYDLDVAMVLSKDWSATHQLQELLKSQGSGQQPSSKIDILDLNIDKNRDAPDEGVQAIQYAFFVHENRFVELEYKREEQERADFRGFAHVRQIYQNLAAQGMAGEGTTQQDMLENRDS